MGFVVAIFMTNRTFYTPSRRRNSVGPMGVGVLRGSAEAFSMSGRDADNPLEPREPPVARGPIGPRRGVPPIAFGLNARRLSVARHACRNDSSRECVGSSRTWS